MQIHIGAGYSNYSAQNAPSARNGASATATAPYSSFKENLAARESKQADAPTLDTSQGSIQMNLNDYFSPDANGARGTEHSLQSLPPLLLPSRKNIDALSDHISSAFPKFLAQNGIPEAPSRITYDQEGKIQLPPDYPYAEEFKQALDKNPTMERELRTLNALTSHYVEMQKGAPFHKEYAAASTPAEAQAVVERYQYLFTNNRHYDTIALLFSEDGTVSLTHDGKPLPQK